MAKKQGKQNHKRIVVSLRHVATPDAEERLARATGILLKAAARGTTKSEDSIKGKRGPARGGLTTGEEGDAHE